MQKWKSIVKSARNQIYISRTMDPFLNLSIEHFLLQNSPPDSNILFLYINRCCVVIGRNQNPWKEVDLRYLEKRHGDLVRRRSGGGTVVHDGGNLNYSVICPTKGFHRNKHVQMVTKAIRATNDRARVNERHDIVLDTGGRLMNPKYYPSADNMHRTKYLSSISEPLKISGSAFKMVRQRCLHHGTCLLAPTEFHVIPLFLASPARAYMKSKGVDSVRSPVGRIQKAEQKESMSEMAVSPMDKLQEDIVIAFAQLYGLDSQSIAQKLWDKQTPTPSIWSEKDWAAGFVGFETEGIQEIADGVAELKSPQWIYGETPEFTLSSDGYIRDDTRGSMAAFPESAQISLKARRGVIEEARLSTSAFTTSSSEQIMFDVALAGKHIHEVQNFADFPTDSRELSGRNVSRALAWLDIMFSKPGRFTQKQVDLG